MLDYLFIGAHSDDCEIFAGGTILYLKSQKYRVGILDLTAGELSTMGNKSLRKKEVRLASGFMGLDYRKTLNLPDGNLILNRENIFKLVKVIRQVKPKIIFTFKSQCRHPDHSQTHVLVKEAFFFSGVKKVLPIISCFKPDNLIYFSDFPCSVIPQFVFNITDFYSSKLKLIKIFSSQVKTEQTRKGNVTFIHSDDFWNVLQGTNLYHGSLIGVKYGEGFFSQYLPQIKNPLDNFQRNFR